MRLFIFLLLTISICTGAFAFGEGKYFKKGLEALEKGDLQAAKVFFNESTNEDPKFSRGYSYLALVQSKLGETEDAILNYKLAFKFDNKDYSSMTNMCGLLMQENRMQEAHEACTIALKINPQSYVALNNRCMIFLNTDRLPSAIADCSQAVLVKEDYYVAYNNRGMAYMGLEQYDKAVNDFSKAIEHNPAYALAYNNRCTAYKELKNYEAGITDCSKALVLDENIVEAYRNRGAIYELVGQKTDAVLDYRKYLRYHPEAESVKQRMERLLKEQ